MLQGHFESKSHQFNHAPIDVLIVDDDPDFLDLLILAIGHIPHVHVVAAHNPRQALERLAQAKYNLIVSDWALDDSTGGEVLRAADRHLSTRAGEPAGKIPVLFISGSEKVSETRTLHALDHFEPVSFVSKRCGAAMIGLVAEQILSQFPTWPEASPC